MTTVALTSCSSGEAVPWPSADRCNRSRTPLDLHHVIACLTNRGHRPGPRLPGGRHLPALQVVQQGGGGAQSPLPPVAPACRRRSAAIPAGISPQPEPFQYKQARLTCAYTDAAGRPGVPGA